MSVADVAPALRAAFASLSSAAASIDYNECIERLQQLGQLNVQEERFSLVISRSAAFCRPFRSSTKPLTPRWRWPWPARPACAPCGSALAWLLPCPPLRGAGWRSPCWALLRRRQPSLRCAPTSAAWVLLRPQTARRKTRCAGRPLAGTAAGPGGMRCIRLASAAQACRIAPHLAGRYQTHLWRPSLRHAASAAAGRRARRPRQCQTAGVRGGGEASSSGHLVDTPAS